MRRVVFAGLSLLALVFLLTSVTSRDEGVRTVRSDNAKPQRDVTAAEDVTTPDPDSAATRDAGASTVIRGVVRASGKPAAGARVTLRGPDVGLQTICDSDGAFRFAGLAPATFDVRCRVAGFIDYGPVPVQTGSFLTIELGGGTAIAGMVVDESGAAVEEAVVHFMNDLGAGRSRTNERGQFRIEGLKFDSLNPTVRASVVAQGFQQRSETLKPEDSPRFILRRDLFVRVQVVDRQERPVKNARFVHSETVALLGGSPELTARHKGQGEFVVGPLTAGFKALVVSAPQHGKARLELPAAPNKETLLRVQLPGISSIRGSLRLDGRAMPGVPLQIVSEHSYRTVTSGPQGGYVVDELSPGEYTLLVRDAGLCGIRSGIQCDSQETREVDVILARATEVRGVLVGSLGEPWRKGPILVVDGDGVAHAVEIGIKGRVTVAAPAGPCILLTAAQLGPRSKGAACDVREGVADARWNIQALRATRPINPVDPPSSGRIFRRVLMSGLGFRRVFVDRWGGDDPISLVAGQYTLIPDGSGDAVEFVVAGR